MVVFGFYIKIGLVGLLNVSGAGLLNPSIDILIDVPKIASYRLISGLFSRSLATKTANKYCTLHEDKLSIYAHNGLHKLQKGLVTL
jgi:hypothetical protein